MSLLRDLHDDLAEELSSASFAIDSLIGIEYLDAGFRSDLREIQNDVGNLLALLREEIEITGSSKAPVFSIEIRELITKIREKINTTNSPGDLADLQASINSILDFPKSILNEGAKRSAKSYDLTKRELEVLRLLPSAATFKAMAISLFLTEATVKTHCASLYRKLEVNNRTGAIAVALEVGLLKRQ